MWVVLGSAWKAGTVMSHEQSDARRPSPLHAMQLGSHVASWGKFRVPASRPLQVTLHAQPC